METPLKDTLSDYRLSHFKGPYKMLPSIREQQRILWVDPSQAGLSQDSLHAGDKTVFKGNMAENSETKHFQSNASWTRHHQFGSAI